jgi:2-polyprenyl-3-methyl-5-hydroxy-6-metoxy-1,4-benzoquinol methylase
MFAWIKTKVNEYWPSPTVASADERLAQPDLGEIGAAPWEIGRPQPSFVSLAQSQQIRGPILDVGCGTGENALYLAGLGFDVNGIDSARAAIEMARAKARVRQVRAYFRMVDALDLACLGTTFETVIDSGLFHLFTDEERRRFLPSLAAVLRPGGTYFMLAFSDQETREGPRRISQAEIHAAFHTGWTVNYIRAATFETRIHDGGAKAWLASITRTNSNVHIAQAQR